MVQNVKEKLYQENVSAYNNMIQLEKEDKRLKEELKVAIEKKLKIQKEEEIRLKEEELRLKKEEELRLKKEVELRKIKEEQVRKIKEIELRLKKEEELGKTKEEELRKINDEELILKKEEIRKIKKKEEEIRKIKEEELRLKKEEELGKIKEIELRLKKEEEQKIRLLNEQGLELKSENVKSFESKIESWRQKYKNLKLLSFKSSSQISKHKRKFQKEIRKHYDVSSLLPFSADEFISGRWPSSKENSRTASTMQKVFIQHLPSAQVRVLEGSEQYESLTHLTISNCNVECLANLDSFPSLKHLNVSSNKVKTVNLFGMKKLESVDLSYNRLNFISCDDCQNLVFLDFSHNNLKKFPNLSSCSNLFHLRATNNSFIDIKKSLPADILKLDLSHNHLISLDGLELCCLLNHVNLEHNQISSFDELSPKLENLLLLLHLNLSHNSIDDVSTLANSWLPSLSNLNISHNQISELTWVQTGVFLENTPNIAAFDISENLISDLRPLLSSLSKCSRIRQIIAHGNLITNADECKEDLFELNRRVDLVLQSREHEAFLSKRSVMKKDLLKTLMLDCETAIELQPNDVMKLAERREITKEETEAMSCSLEWVASKQVGSIFHPDAISIHCEYLRKLHSVCSKLRSFLLNEDTQGAGDLKKEVKNDDLPLTNPDIEKSLSITNEGNKISTSPNKKESGLNTNESKTEKITRNNVPNEENTNTYPTTKNEHQQKPADQITKTVNCTSKNSPNNSEFPDTPTNFGPSCNDDFAIKTKIINAKILPKSFETTVNTDRHDNAVDDCDVTKTGRNDPVDYDVTAMDEIDLSQLEFNEELFEQQWAFKVDNFKTDHLYSDQPTTSLHFESPDPASLERVKSPYAQKPPLPPIPVSPIKEYRTQSPVSVSKSEAPSTPNT